VFMSMRSHPQVGVFLCLKSASETRDDFVLHVEEIGQRLIERRCHANLNLAAGKLEKLSSDSGRGGGSPRPERFFSEDAERAAGCEMALDVECVVDGGVNGQEALG
jgi:hypothetical protein